jgi:hypothetical protein
MHKFETASTGPASSRRISIIIALEFQIIVFRLQDGINVAIKLEAPGFY